MDVRSWAVILFPGFIVLHSVSAQTPDWVAGIAKVTTRNADLAPGTAIVVAIRNDSAFLITGSHVIAGDSRPQIDFVADATKTYRASIVANNFEDKSRGLAILKVQDPPKGLRALAPGTVPQGARVKIGGFPAPAARFTLLDPSIARIEGLDLILTQETGVGYSGGPVILDGRVVGLVFGHDPGHGKAIKSATVREYLDGYGIAWEASTGSVTNAPPPSTVERPKPRGPRVGETRVNPIDGQTYVYIPAGTFTMGCSKGDTECDRGESPAHDVEITRGFWIGRTETTQGAYSRVIKTNPSGFKGNNRPVESVTWSEAKGFCEAVKMRLPTEAEWEYAARAGSQAARYGTVENIAWYIGNSAKETHPVAQKAPNGWGLYDTLGNVWEWVNDWEGPYSRSQATDPRGPSTREYRVVRGGAWDVNPQVVRVSFRDGLLPAFRNYVTGFRCAGQ